MEQKNKRFIECILFTIVLVMVLYGVYQILRWKDTTGDYKDALQQLYNTEGNLIDVAFLGSSHCYCGIAPAVLWENSGIAAFDMSVSGQDRQSTYHALKELLKTQSPKIVCVDLYGLSFEEHGIEGNKYRNMLSMKTSRNSIELVKNNVNNVAPEEQLDYITRWPILHTRYKELKKYDFVEYEYNQFSRGFVCQWNATEPFINPYFETERCGGLTDEHFEWLESLYKLSLEEDFQLVYMIIPYHITEEQQARYNQAAEFAEERSIPVIDLNKLSAKCKLDYGADFGDIYHLNSYGAVKVTTYMNQYLVDNFELQDHRGEAAYWQWDKDLEWFYHSREVHELSKAEDAEDYLKKIKQTGHLLTVVSLEAKHESQGDYYYDLLENLGIPPEESRIGGKWIVLDGQTQKILENVDDGSEYLYDLSNTETLRVRFKEDLDPQNIQINRQTYLQPHYHLTVLTYDLMDGKVLESRGY